MNVFYIIALFLFRSLFSKIFIFLIFIFFLLFLTIPYLIGFHFGHITGTTVSCDLSYSSLLTGTVYFNEITIYSSDDFKGEKAIVLHEVQPHVNLFSFIFGNKDIETIKSNWSVAHAIIAKNDVSNLEQIEGNIKNYYYKHKQEEGDLEFGIKDIYLNNLTLYVTDKDGRNKYEYKSIHLNTFKYKDPSVLYLYSIINSLNKKVDERNSILSLF